MKASLEFPIHFLKIYSSNEILKALLVVLRHLLARPSPATVQWFDRVDGTDNLLKGSPDVFFLCQATIRGKITRRENPKGFTKVGTHFCYPLGDESSWRDHESTLHQSSELQFPHNEPSLDGFAEPDFIGQQ